MQDNNEKNGNSGVFMDSASRDAIVKEMRRQNPMCDINDNSIKNSAINLLGEVKKPEPVFRRKDVSSDVGGSVNYGPRRKPAMSAKQTVNNSEQLKTKGKSTKSKQRSGADGALEFSEVVGGRSAKIAKSSVNLGKAVKIVYLGGVGEIGKNMTAIEQNGEIVVIDCGVMFPSEDMPGIDLVIPDYTYLKDNASKVKAFLITHGHEDHIGAIPYVLKDFPNAVIYSSKFTIALIENKVKEHNLKNLKFQVVEPRKEYKIGGFVAEFVNVNHSIADAFAIRLKTNAGVIFHTGDFKIDFRPIDGKMIDLTRIAEIGEKGVDLLMCESTNVERPGYTISESDVGAKIEEIFKESVGRRVFVATFSSNLYRIQQIINHAIKYDRKVAIVGRSILNNLDAASRVGKFEFSKKCFIDIDKMQGVDDGNILVLCTGAQGEPASALSRLANGDFAKIEIGENDTVILSSSPIPGNEAMVNRVINNLCRKGAIVIHEDVHASGHACQEELKILHSLIKPKNFIPVHGEYRHLKKHGELAESLGTPADHILLVENGNVVKLSNGTISRLPNVKAGEVLIDGNGVGDLSSVVLRDRKQLSEDGIAIVTIALSKENNTLLSPPVILTRGLVYTEEADELNAEIQKIVIDALDNILKLPKFEIEEAKNLVRRPIRNFLNKKMGRMPLILPIFHLI